MKLALATAMLLFCVAVHAQDLPRRPEAPKTNDLSLDSLALKPVVPEARLSEGMVWAWRDKAWHPAEVGSCEYCARPMTFKQAAFDRKAAPLYLLEIGLTVADVELGQSCLRAGKCREGNPFLGGGSRRLQYSIRLPSIAANWWAVAMLRKGNKRENVGGMKHWYVFPMVFQGLSTIGVLSSIGK